MEIQCQGCPGDLTTDHEKIAVRHQVGDLSERIDKNAP